MRRGVAQACVFACLLSGGSCYRGEPVGLDGNAERVDTEIVSMQSEMEVQGERIAALEAELSALATTCQKGIEGNQSEIKRLTFQIASLQARLAAAPPLEEILAEQAVRQQEAK